MHCMHIAQVHQARFVKNDQLVCMHKKFYNPPKSIPIYQGYEYSMFKILYMVHVPVQCTRTIIYRTVSLQMI